MQRYLNPCADSPVNELNLLTVPDQRKPVSIDIQAVKTVGIGFITVCLITGAGHQPDPFDFYPVSGQGNVLAPGNYPAGVIRDSLEIPVLKLRRIDAVR